MGWYLVIRYSTGFEKSCSKLAHVGISKRNYDNSFLLSFCSFLGKSSFLTCSCKQQVSHLISKMVCLFTFILWMLFWRHFQCVEELEVEGAQELIGIKIVAAVERAIWKEPSLVTFIHALRTLIREVRLNSHWAIKLYRNIWSSVGLSSQFCATGNGCHLLNLPVPCLLWAGGWFQGCSPGDTFTRSYCQWNWQQVVSSLPPSFHYSFISAYSMAWYCTSRKSGAVRFVRLEYLLIVWFLASTWSQTPHYRPSDQCEV